MRRSDWTMPRPATIAIALLLSAAYLHAGTADYEAARAAPRHVRVLHAVNDPMNPPRCPKVNADGAHLTGEVAMSADGEEWIHACEYQPERSS